FSIRVFSTLNRDFEYGEFGFRINRELTESFTVTMQVIKDRNKSLFPVRESLDFILHFVHRISMLRGENPQLLNLIFKHQLFFDTLIARAKCFDLRVCECLLVYIFALW
ncbi:MAG: hypothetical protein IJJ57_04490, partial [Ruminococcus sp.]|nr:hypothetical protein [Ruminococcus sp.]